MIRINLLQVDRERARAKTTTFQPGQRLTLACSLILVVTGLGLVWWWWALDRQSTQLDTDIVKAEREVNRLKTLIQQVESFEERKQKLQQRVALIEELRQGQGAPVHLLDQLSRAIPEMLWLTELTQDDNGELTIAGRCVTLTALSDFVANLERSGYFGKPDAPVEIVDSQVESGSGAVGELIRFSIRAKFELPGPAPSAPAKAAATTGAQ
jgi:type IV pilus assembly protein PilN